MLWFDVRERKVVANQKYIAISDRKGSEESQHGGKRRVYYEIKHLFSKRRGFGRFGSRFVEERTWY
jgi:hypothetical protein